MYRRSWKRKIRNKMKRIRIHRLLWALGLLGSAVLIGFRGGAASFLIFWSFVLMPVFSLAFKRIVLTGVVIRLEISDSNVVRGERLPCTLRLINDTFLPLPTVRIRMYDGKVHFPEEEQELTCSLQPGEERAFDFEPLCRHCGAALLGASSIEIPDYFLLTEAKYQRTERIHILPRRQRLEQMLKLPPKEEERRQVDRSYFGDRVPDGQWRLYQPGDDIRRIHWKLTARQQQLIMKNLIPEPKNEMVLIPDGRDALPEGRAGWLAEDSIVEGTLAIADYYLRFGIALQVVPDLSRQVSLMEASSYDRLYKLMAKGFFSGKERADDVLGQLEAMNGSRRYILLTWDVDEAFIRNVSSSVSRGADITLIYIGDSSEPAALASSERKLAFYQVTSRNDIFRTLQGSKGGLR